MWFKKKKLIVPHQEGKEYEVLPTWTVKWFSTEDKYFTETEAQFEVFTSKKEAEDFAESLRAATKLLRNTYTKGVEVIANQ